MHPKLTWCYMGEDMMGKMRALVMACAKGIPPWAVGDKVLDRYAYALDLTVKDPEKWLKLMAKHRL